MPSWAPPNAPRLSEGLFGAGLGPYPPQSAQLTHSEIVPSHNILQKHVRVRPLLTVIPPYCYNKSSVSLKKGVRPRHAPSWGIKHNLPSNIFLLKTHSKDYSHRKFCKQDNFINFILKKPQTKTAKETQNKTCWMKTVNANFFYCLNKKNDIHLQHFFSKFTWQRLKYCFILTQHTTALCDRLCYFGKSWDLWSGKSGAH